MPTMNARRWRRQMARRLKYAVPCSSDCYLVHVGDYIHIELIGIGLDVLRIVRIDKDGCAVGVLDSTLGTRYGGLVLEKME